MSYSSSSSGQGRQGSNVISPGGYSISGAWTQAGFASAVHIVKGKSRQDEILFDCGSLQPEILSANTVFITHSHVDHIGAVIMHARSRTIRKSYATYYVPAEAVDALLEAKEAYQKMDSGEIVLQLQPVSPGDCIRVSASTIVKVFATVHRIASQGYAVYSTQPGKLKADYQNCLPHELQDLRNAGRSIKEPDKELLELVYTGDTTFEGLLLPENEFVFHAPILITELTYIDGPYEKAIEYGHIHMEDIQQHAHMFQNSHIIFCHLSAKYVPHGKALRLLRSGLPEALLSRSYATLKYFGASEAVTKVSNVNAELRNKEVGWGWGKRAAEVSSGGHHERKQKRIYAHDTHTMSLSHTGTGGYHRRGNDKSKSAPTEQSGPPRGRAVSSSVASSSVTSVTSATSANHLHIAPGGGSLGGTLPSHGDTSSTYVAHTVDRYAINPKTDYLSQKQKQPFKKGKK